MTTKRVIAALLASASVVGCSSVSYRCPLDPRDTPDEVTACVGMKESLTNSRRGLGSKNSVMVDEKGRLITPESKAGLPASPLTGASNEPYHPKSGDPAFVQPKVFQAWVPAFVDAEGNLHDGHHTWFATPGRWGYGTTKDSGSVGDTMLRPSVPSDQVQPMAGAVPQTSQVQPKAAQVEQQAPSAAQQGASARAAAFPVAGKDKDKAALKSLSAAANSAATGTAQKNTGGITAPAVGLAD